MDHGEIALCCRPTDGKQSSNGLNSFRRDAEVLGIGLDAAAFAVPLAALLIAYVLLARPAWFQNWVEDLYREPPR